MKIPKELLDKYKICQNESFTDELGIYKTFLIQTDHEILKGFESLLAEPSKFLANFVTLAKTLKEVVGYRATAREEIARLSK